MEIQEIHPRVDAAVAKIMRSGVTPDAINQALVALFVDLFEVNGQLVRRGSPYSDYSEVIRLGFYTEQGALLRVDRREYVILPLLAMQQAERNLGLHVFIALVNGMTPAEVVNVMFLTGVYAGTNVLTNSLRVVAKAFDAIIAAADAIPPDRPATVIDVLQKIMSAFPDPEYDAARKRMQGERRGDGGPKW
jgi:Carboxymuconolactone decarboxylase family